jgi:tetrahydromethanopterin S-methyltransferase subunit E
MKGNMNRRDFLVIAIIGIVLGLLLLAGGIFAASYHTRFVSFSLFMNPIEVYPYAAYSGSLLGGGAVSIFVGITFALLATQKETSVKPLPLPTDPKQPSPT